MKRFTDALEKKCRELVRQEKGNQDASPATLIELEIAITLDQIDTVRNQNSELQRRLEEQRLDIESRILNLEPLRHHSSQFWFERNRMKIQLTHTLARIEQQFQRLTLESQKTLQALQNRLLELWNMHTQLQENG